MRGSADDQVRLVLAFEEWQSAEAAAEMLAPFFPKARLQDCPDALHDELFAAACFCGFDPCGIHREVPLVEWAAVRVALNRHFFEPHIAEAINRREL